MRAGEGPVPHCPAGQGPRAAPSPAREVVEQSSSQHAAVSPPERASAVGSCSVSGLADAKPAAGSRQQHRSTELQHSVLNGLDGGLAGCTDRRKHGPGAHTARAIHVDTYLIQTKMVDDSTAGCELCRG